MWSTTIFITHPSLGITLTVYPFYTKKIPTIFSKNEPPGPWGPPVRDMPRHELEMIKLLVIATPLVKTVINDVLEPFPNFSRRGSTYRLVELINVRLKSFKTSYFISFCIFEEKN